MRVRVRARVRLTLTPGLGHVYGACDRLKEFAAALTLALALALA